MYNFFNSISQNLTNTDISLLLNLSYLTDSNPDSFSFISLFVLLIVLDLLVMGVLFVLLKKKVVGLIGKRKLILKDLIKYNVIFSLIWLVFIILRYQEVEYLSMRLWHLLFILLFCFGNCIAVFVYFRTKETKQVSSAKSKGTINYQDYLPKKNKKRKK